MLTDTIKDALLGRNIEILDDAVFRLSNRRLTSWAIANQLKNRWLGRAGGASDEPLVIVGGCPRSGTTLLQMMLKVHDNIDGPYREVCLFEDTVKRAKLSKEFDLAEEEVERIWKSSDSDVMSFWDGLFSLYREIRGIRRILLKAPKSIFLAERLFRHFPEMKFVHIIRDGRDAAVSMQRYFLKQQGKSFPFSYGAKTWAASIRTGQLLRRHHDAYFEVQYEDLIENPEDTMIKLFEFLKEPDYSIERVVNFNRHIEADQVATHKEHLSSPINSTAVSRWRTEMSAAQIQEFQAVAGNELVELGYADK